MNNESTIIIAEAGVNHNGKMDIAKKLVDSAADAGADMVKFQTFSADRLVTTSARKAEYQNQTTDSSESQYDMIKNLELSREMHEELIDHCRKCGIEFFSTGFDVQSIDMLLELGLEKFKIPSGEVTNLPYLRHVGKYAKSVIISTGMTTLEEIGESLEVLEKSGTPRKNITVLQCNTEYPTPMEDVNLNAMLTIREAFGVAVGCSDHTLGIEVPIAAVALGAKVVEKHFTLDRHLSGPDHKASLTPNELKSMVKAIRNIEKALGNGIKSPRPSELNNIPIVRKSLVAATVIRTGERFTDTNLTVKRPGTGISPMCWDDVIGRSAKRDFEADELIKL
jgi:N,N'-diacetyllegionaminate synthase